MGVGPGQTIPLMVTLTVTGGGDWPFTEVTASAAVTASRIARATSSARWPRRATTWTLTVHDGGPHRG